MSCKQTKLAKQIKNAEQYPQIFNAKYDICGVKLTTYRIPNMHCDKSMITAPAKIFIKSGSSVNQNNRTARYAPEQSIMLVQRK